MTEIKTADKPKLPSSEYFQHLVEPKHVWIITIYFRSRLVCLIRTAKSLSCLFATHHRIPLLFEHLSLTLVGTFALPLILAILVFHLNTLHLLRHIERYLDESNPIAKLNRGCLCSLLIWVLTQ